MYSVMWRKLVVTRKKDRLWNVVIECRTQNVESVKERKSWKTNAVLTEVALNVDIPEQLILP